MVGDQRHTLIKSRFMVEKSSRRLFIDEGINVRNFFQNIRLLKKFVKALHTLRVKATPRQKNRETVSLSRIVQTINFFSKFDKVH